MAKKIRIDNPDVTTEAQSYLTSDYSSGVTLNIRNNQSFVANYFVVVGEPTQEQTELKQISALSGNAALTIASALKFAHSKSIPVYQSQWDKVSVERKSSGGSYAEITSSPFDITWDDDENTTLINDASGADGHTYRWRFYNSVTGTYSAYSGELSGAGLSRDQAGYVIQKVRKNKLLADGVDDDTMYEYMTDFQDLVYEKLPEAWWFEKEGTEVATEASEYKYSIEDNWPDLSSINYIIYKYVSGSTTEEYPISYMSAIEFMNRKRNDSDATEDDDHVSNWTLLPPDTDSDKGYIGLDATPESANCFIRPVYYFELEDITDFSDTLVIPKPKAYEDYVLYRIASDIKNDDANEAKYAARNEANILSLKKRSKRQMGQKELLKFRGQKGYNRMFNGISSYYRDVDRKVTHW